MHIAICDDNIVDRKQMERLIKKEADKRTSFAETLYADSFGNITALLSTPIQYDIFFIDICKTKGITGVDVATGLIKQGVTAPIVLCCSEINYRETMSKNTDFSDPDFPDNIIFIEKPISPEELSRNIDLALSIKNAAPNLIELREEHNTVYVTEAEFIYAVTEGPYVTVTLTDGRKVHAVTTAENLFTQLDLYPSFMLPSLKTIINGRYIHKLSFRKAHMIDGTCFKMPKDCMAYAKQLLLEYHERQ